MLPFLKLFSEEPVVTRHLCLGGGCVVSPPCLFPTFFTKHSGGFGAPCGTSYLLLSFQASRGEWLVPPPIIEPFLKNNESVFGGLYIVWVMWAQTDTSRNRMKSGVHSSLSPLHRVHWWGKSSASRIVDFRAARMYHFHCQPLCRQLRKDLCNGVGFTSSVMVISKWCCIWGMVK